MAKQPGLSPTKGQRIAAETRRYQMLELAKAGATERQIADTLGVSRALVHKDIKRVLGDLARSAARSADSVRVMQMERYTSLLSRWWSQALAGDETATHMVLKIMARVDVINGIIPDKPLIDMRTQTIQVGEGIGLMELARVVANGNGSRTNGSGPGDARQPDIIPDSGPGSNALPEATADS